MKRCAVTDALVDTLTRLKLRPVPRVANLPAAEFRELYMKAHKPVVLRDMARSWPALKKWTPEYLAREYGSLPVKLYDGTFIRAGSSYMSSLRKVPFREYLDLMLHSSADLRLFAFNIFWQAPELRDDLRWPAIMKGFSRRFVFMFFGCKGSVTPLHYDPDLPHLMHTVLYGIKRVILFPNRESRNLYKHPFSTRSYVDVDHPDFGKFPRLAAAKGYQAILRPGETLFMPSGYWHHMVYEEAGYALCTRNTRLSIARKLHAYGNMFVCFPIDKIMNKLYAEPWFRWKEQRARR
jgi:cupin-like protein